MKRINYSFYFLIFNAAIVSSVLIVFLYKTFPLSSSKTLFFCQKLISDIMIEIPRSLSGTLVLTTGAILTIGLLSFLVQLIRTHLLLRRLLKNKVKITGNLIKIIASLGLTNKVTLVKDNNLFSFCFGVFSPHIVITTALINSLAEKELEAVLLHEQSHLINKDPMKLLVGKTISSMFFFLPIFRELHKNIEGVNELLADQWTIKYQQRTTFLRGALKKILSTPQLNLATVSGVSGPDYFEIRIYRLVNPGVKHKFTVSLISLFTSIIFVLTSWFLLLTPVNANHMGFHSSSPATLGSSDQTCSEQCHSAIDKRKTYAPSQSIFVEKECKHNDPGSSKNISKSALIKDNYSPHPAQTPKHQLPFFSD